MQAVMMLGCLAEGVQVVVRWTETGWGAQEPRGSLRMGSALHSRSRGTGLLGSRWASIAKVPARDGEHETVVE